MNQFVNEKAEVNPIIRLDKSIWLTWVLACGLIPIFMTGFSYLFQSYNLSDWLVSLGVTYLLIIGACVAISLTLFWALRRFVPSLSLGTWFLVALTTWLINNGLLFSLKLTQINLKRPIIDLSFKASFNLGDIASLLKVIGLNLGYVALTAITMYLLVVMVLAKTTRLPWRLFLVAAVLAECSTALLDLGYLYFHIIDQNLIVNSSLADVRLNINEIATSAVWGAVSGGSVWWQVIHHGYEQNKLDISPFPAWLILPISFFLVLLPITMSYVRHPNALSNMLNGINKLFVSKPEKDISTGENHLAFSHRLAIDPPSYPVLDFAPDNKTLTIRNADEELIAMDIQTGKVLANLVQIDAHIHPYAAHWSPDARYLALMFLVKT